jgi:hypothetical protein
MEIKPLEAQCILHQTMPSLNQYLEDCHMAYEDEEDPFHPISVPREFTLKHTAAKHNFENEGT